MFKTNTMESGEKQRLTLQEAENIIKTEIDHILESGVNAIRLTELFTRIMTRVLSSKEHDLKTLRAFTDHLETQFRETAGRLAEVESKYASQLQPIREKPDFEKMASQYLKSLGQRSDIEWEVKQYGEFGERIWKDYVELSGNQK
jgi:hypothetical protein